MEMQEIIGDYQAFFGDISDHLQTLGVDISKYPLSHLGIKFASFEEYEHARDAIKKHTAAFAENEHNGRPIAVMQLRTPLHLSRGCSVDILELMPPKPDNKYPTGLEHLGVVIGAALEEFAATHQSVITGRQDQGPLCKPFFILLDTGKRVKFYDLALKDVIEKEGKSFISL
ncbi:MAG TPA: VOC family protein [Candidatus Paceibacterota bacterium]|nr:VOC family protein [Candidatus Paceibacterota bacterium]